MKSKRAFLLRIYATLPVSTKENIMGALPLLWGSSYFFCTKRFDSSKQIVSFFASGQMVIKHFQKYSVSNWVDHVFQHHKYGIEYLSKPARVPYHYRIYKSLIFKWFSNLKDLLNSL